MSNYPKVAEFTTLEAFKDYLAKENIEIGFTKSTAAMQQEITLYGKKISNRWAIYSDQTGESVKYSE